MFLYLVGRERFAGEPAGVKSGSGRMPGRAKVGMPLEAVPCFSGGSDQPWPRLPDIQTKIRECLGEASLPWHERRRGRRTILQSIRSFVIRVPILQHMSETISAAASGTFSIGGDLPVNPARVRVHATQRAKASGANRRTRTPPRPCCGAWWTSASISSTRRIPTARMSANVSSRRPWHPLPGRIRHRHERRSHPPGAEPLDARGPAPSIWGNAWR